MAREDFIGTTRCLPSGGKLTVVGVHESYCKKGWWKGVYYLHCSLCSTDVELWPHGSIRITKGHFKDGNIPCGCSPINRMSPVQLRVLVERHCAKYNLKLLPCDIINRSSYVFIGRDDGTSFKARVRDLFKSSTGDYILKGKLLRDVNVHISDFNKTGKFLKGTLFLRTEDPHIWKVICPKCSLDEFSVNNLCSGIFEAKIDNLKSGKRPCRCVPRPMTEDQAKFKTINALSENGHTLYDWFGWVSGVNSKFKWICEEGHVQETSYTNYVHNKTGCVSCVILQQQMDGYGYGYYPHRKDEDDFLYITEIVSSGGTVFKIGRSFNYSEREKDLTKQYKERFYLTRLFKGKHAEVFKEEGRLHELLRQKGKQFRLGSAREFFSIFTNEVNTLKVRLEEINI